MEFVDMCRCRPAGSGRHRGPPALAVDPTARQPADEVGSTSARSRTGRAGPGDSWIDPDRGIPGEPAPGQLAGLSLAGSTAGLYVGVPYGPKAGHAVHLFPRNVASGGAPTHTPSSLAKAVSPEGDTAFGATVR
jgi:hypothetical protein